MNNPNFTPKISYLLNARFPSERAHSIQVVQMCQAFVQQGAEVTLYVNTRKTDIGENPDIFYGQKLAFTTKRVWTPDIMHWGIVGFFISTLAYNLNLLRYLEKDTVLYTRNEWILLFLLFIRPKQKKVYESHEAKFNLAVKIILNKGVTCVCVSEGVKYFYLQQKIPVEQLVVAHDGIDDSFLQKPISKETARENLKLSSDKKIAMYIGGFDTWKGVETYFAAATAAPEIQFVAIGGKESSIKQYQKKYPAVLFLGPRPYRELAQHQQAADVLVIPNTHKNKLSAEYTSPLKAFAHMASEVPIIVSDIPSLRAILSEDQAFFFTPDDSQALANTIKKVVASPVVVRTKAKAAKAEAGKYTWDARAQRILNCLS